MWISVEPGILSSADVLVPAGLLKRAARMLLRYGTGQYVVTVQAASVPASAGTSPSTPARLIIHPAIIDKLKIRTEPTYRAIVQDGTLEIGPVMGLLLGPRNHWYDHQYMSREAERVTEVYPRTGGLICAFSPRNYSRTDDCVYGMFYDPRERCWRYSTLPIPAVLHRRSFFMDPRWVQHLHNRGARIFNSRRFTKWELYQILSQDASFRNHLPETALVDQGDEVFSLLKRHRTVILKPSDLSRGRGILFVQAEGPAFKVMDCRQGAPRVSTRSGDSLRALLAEEVAGRRYLCQEKIDLATIAGSPFDIRVVMQRCPKGQWGCTGIECRLAGQGHMITNIAQGGRAMWLSEAVTATFGDAVDLAATEQSVKELAVQVCQLMDQTGEHFAEFGMDLAFDRAGKLWFIENNVIPGFKGFAILDSALYRRILAAPLLYANSLAGFGGDEHGPGLSGGIHRDAFPYDLSSRTAAGTDRAW